MPKMTRWASLAVATLVCCVLAGAADPIPTADAQSKAEKVIRDLFKSEYAKAKLPAEKAALAEKLLLQGSDTKDDSVARFVLFREARDLAAESGAMPTSFRAIDAMAKSYDIDLLTMKIDALNLAAKSAPPTARRTVADVTLSLTDAAVSTDNYDAAFRLATVALTAARAVANTALTQQATLRLKEIEEMKTAFVSVKSAQAVLKNKPTDIDANTTVGKFLCLMKGEWEKGVPMLALGADPELKRLAEMELGKPADGKDKAAMGDGWWELADKVPAGTAKTQLQLRSGHWYRQANAELTGLSKTKVEKHLAELEKLLPNAVGVRKAGDEVHFPLPGGLKMTFCWIPPGTAQLGCPKAELDALVKAGRKLEFFTDTAEEARGRYTTKGFWLGKYPVTQAEWQALTGDNPSHFRAAGKGAEKVKGLDTRRHPVEMVSWDDCQTFLKKLNAVEGVEQVFGKAGKFALPHEDAWEYACRGGLGNARTFYWGNELNGAQSNINGNFPFGTATKGTFLERTTPVGSYATKAPHPWGLCDMLGNVMNWCENELPENKHAARGGAWGLTAGSCRSAGRFKVPSDAHASVYGLRVYLSAD